MDQKPNYQKELERVIEQEQSNHRVPKLLLHSCCAPCSSYVLEYLSQYFEITDLYYNPNIYPPEEYELRAKELERLAQVSMARDYLHPVKVIRGDYDPKLFFDMAKGLEKEPEGGERCMKCYRLRLEEAARMAIEQGADYFATTLTISPLKNSAKLNEIGYELQEVYGVKYLPSDFKKKNGYKRSVELSAIYNLYRQDYCGCVYSKAEAQARALQTQKSRVQ